MCRPVSALWGLRDRALRGRPRLRPRNRLTVRLLLVLAFLGPGLIAANAGNDAGGVATYASVGAKYGYDLLWMMVVITVSLIVVQEMAARMGAVTGKGLAELIREQYGVRWSAFATVSVLVANLGICISEFVGIGAALGLAHVPKYASIPVAAVFVWLLLVRGSYKVAERVFVLMTIPFFAYPVAAILARPRWRPRRPRDRRTPRPAQLRLPRSSSSRPPARRSRRSCSSTSSPPSSRRESARSS